MASKQRTANKNLDAKGGGNATASGVNFQASLGALFASQLMAERQIDEGLRLGKVKIQSIRFETEAPLDDILIETTESGWIFVQAKTALTLSSKLDSELGKTAKQIVRQWLTCVAGQGNRGWDRPLAHNLDRILIATGTTASRTISYHLASALVALQMSGTAPLPKQQREAQATFTKLIKLAWKKIDGRSPDKVTVQSLLKLITVLPFDLDGADQRLGVETLRHVLQNPAEAESAFAVLAHKCTDLMQSRHGLDGKGFRQMLTSANISLLAPPSYIEDVKNLRIYSNRIHSLLEQYEETTVNKVTIKISRQCTQVVVDATLVGSLLLVGEPGAGKSAVVSAATKKLRETGYDVIQLAVDQFGDGLRQELGLTHPIRDVLTNWPGPGPMFLFIDALDASRGGPSESVFRSLIADVLSLPDKRWRLVASIRTFDLRLGEQFKTIFRGSPPDSSYADENFSNVRHVHVPIWSQHEMDEFLEQAPLIKTVIKAGGYRLHDLARVPFNMKLLADLINGGIQSSNFGEVRNQVELLKLYWSHRISKHGTGAELCIQSVVKEMINARTLRAQRLETSKSNPTAFDELLREHVLVPSSGDRFVAFRHHILFDYAASRVYLNPEDIDQTVALLTQNHGPGLMLAPAFAFALQELWVDTNKGRAKFWEAVTRIAGDERSDPIARSVAARIASELPEEKANVRGLSDLFQVEGEKRTYAVSSLRHIIGALAVRVEDKQPLILEPWCELALLISTGVTEKTIWSLRTLMYLLIDRIETPEQQNDLGKVSRAILSFSLDQPNSPSQLTASAIGFVGDTYTSNISASRELLEQLFQEKRFQNHADQDMPWLADKIESIATADPTFAAQIYSEVFGREVNDSSATSMGNSQILPLQSNRRQDYGMAPFKLKQFFPRFIDIAPSHALSSLINAVAGHVTKRRPINNAKSWAIYADVCQTQLQEDGCHYWAWDPDAEHGENIQGLLKAFVTKLRQADATTVRVLVEAVVSGNKFAILWARMFLVGAERPEIIGDLLWPFAIQEPFLSSLDTAKDVIDFIAARYQYESIDTRKAFEEAVLDFKFSQYSKPDDVRQIRLKTLFGRIGSEYLVTESARTFLPMNLIEPGHQPQNRRPFKITSGTTPLEPWWWLPKKDVEAPANAQILAQAEQIKIEFQLNDDNHSLDDIAGAVARIDEFWRTSQNEAQNISPSVAECAAGIVAQGAVKLSGLPVERLLSQPNQIKTIIELVLKLVTHASPEVNGETEASLENSPAWGSLAPRIEAAEAVMNLCRLNKSIVGRFKVVIERLLSDKHPDVRMSVAVRLTSLWETARPLMWRLAERIARKESNRGVLLFFANRFLTHTLHHEPARVEALIFTLLKRTGDKTEKPEQELLGELGGLIALLWISHARPDARRTLQDWLCDAPTHKTELMQAIFVSRGALVLGYSSKLERDMDITKRAQEFAAWAVESTARGLKNYLQRYSNTSTPESEKQRGTLFAELLDNICNQFYFASGAFRGSQGGEPKLTSEDQKRSFLSDTYAALQKIADAGTPSAIHYLIQMLEFFISAEPHSSFDLIAHAILGAGKRHGYQFESLGADRLVSIIGLFIADHRSLFEDDERRQKLIKCLEVFMEAGWPAAQRLLYRLPELLQ